MGKKLKQAGLVLWALVTVLLALTLGMEHRLNAELRERIVLWVRMDRAVSVTCEGVEAVNDICLAHVTELYQRLGLNEVPIPVLSAALHLRAERSYPAARERAARRGESRRIEAKQPGVALGGPLE